MRVSMGDHRSLSMAVRKTLPRAIPQAKYRHRTLLNAIICTIPVMDLKAGSHRGKSNPESKVWHLRWRAISLRDAMVMAGQNLSLLTNLPTSDCGCGETTNKLQVIHRNFS